MSLEEFRQHGHAAVDWICEYLRTIETRPVRSTVAPGEIRASLPASAPEHAEDFSACLRDFENIILPGITHWQSPNFFAYFPCNGSPPAILGELLSAGLGVQGMLWQTSPACTELETHVLDWLVDLLGLPAFFKSDSTGGGVIQDTASSSALCAILAARERATAGRTNRSGIDRRLIAYTSEQAHSSIEKGLRVAGIGSDQLRLMPVDERCAIGADALAEAMARDRRAGAVPFFVCATIGTTAANGIDPIRRVGELTQRYGAWLHVDAAMCGTAMLCPEFRIHNDGVDLADSWCFNPHKWMFTSFDCDCLWVRRRADLIGALSILPDYLRNAATESGAVIDYRDWQIPLGRRFRALKLWFVLRCYGAAGLRQLVREHVRLARLFADLVRADERFELALDPPLNLVCFRRRGEDAINQRLIDKLNAGGKIYLSHALIHGRFALRMSIGGTWCEERHVHQAWRFISETEP